MARKDDRKGRKETMIAETIPVLEEELVAGKRERVTGRVRVTMHAETVEEVVEQALESIHAHVTRIPVNRDLEPGAPIPVMRTLDGLTIVPVLEEVLVVEKRLRFVEELHIKQQKSVEQVSTAVSLRKQSAQVEQTSEPETRSYTED